MSFAPGWLKQTDVSRETFADLQAYHDLLIKWNPKINLVSGGDIADLWLRHIWDSAQIWRYAAGAQSWVDLGSGGGFPALVCAIFAKSEGQGLKITCIESDQRKSEFLRTVVRMLSLNVDVVVNRAEKVEPVKSDIVSARALSDLASVLDMVERHVGPAGRALLPKGVRWKFELAEARKIWHFKYDAHTSKTDPKAVVLEVRELTRV